MGSLLQVLAVLSGAVGVFTISQATLGVGFICGGCLLGIMARLVQAETQHKETVKLLSHLAGIRGHASEAVKVLRQAHNLPEDSPTTASPTQPTPPASVTDRLWKH
jgi:hypothetical protein